MEGVGGTGNGVKKWRRKSNAWELQPSISYGFILIIQWGLNGSSWICVRNYIRKKAKFNFVVVFFFLLPDPLIILRPITFLWHQRQAGGSYKATLWVQLSLDLCTQYLLNKDPSLCQFCAFFFLPWTKCYFAACWHSGNKKAWCVTQQHHCLVMYNTCINCYFQTVMA